MERGDIWMVDLGRPTGSEPGFRRPVLILQADRLNRSRIGTILCAALSTNLRLLEAPGTVYVAALASGLPADSVVNLTQISSLARQRLERQVGRVPPQLMDEVDDALRLVLQL